MDRQSVYSLSVLPPDEDGDTTRTQILKALQDFILEFRLDNAFIYRSETTWRLLQSYTNIA